MNQYADLSIIQVISAYIFIVVLLLIVRWRGISREKQILLASVRMTLQLILIAYVLTYVFQSKNLYLTLLMIVIMEAFAIMNIFRRLSLPIHRRLKKIVLFSMVVGTSLSIVYFMFIVLRLDPWFDPRRFIPISGMIIGNSMTGITLGMDRLINGIRSQKDRIENALMLGATPKRAIKRIVDQSFDAAILPTLNSMIGMGIVFLPGMMTGQILSGISPFSAIKYQMIIMLGVLGSVSLSVFFSLYFGVRTYFNEHAQFMVDGVELEENE